MNYRRQPYPATSVAGRLLQPASCSLPSCGFSRLRLALPTSCRPRSFVPEVSIGTFSSGSVAGLGSHYLDQRNLLRRGTANFLDQFLEVQHSLLGEPQHSAFPIWWRGAVGESATA